MGHLGQLKEEYRELARRLDATYMPFPAPRSERARQAWKEILEILYTPEDAALAAQMPLKPASAAALCRRLGMPEAELTARLEAMCDRGVVMDARHPKSGEVRYMLAPPLAGFLEFSMMRTADHVPKKRMAEAIEAYCHGDETFAAEILSGETKFGRTLVHETALRDETPEVLGWERASAIVEESPLVAVTLCYCRHVAEHLGRRCEAPMENCLSFGQAADFIVRRGFGHSIEKAQAQEILAVARGAGLVQIADNVKKRPVFICNCCGCCCEQLQAIRRFGLPAVNPSGLQPVHAADACKGCSRCARICPVGAITMVARLEPGRSRNELRPSIDLDRCIGCGVCADGCRKHAVGLERRPEQPKVPETGMERVVLMALDQGVLGELLFEDAGRGGRFLGRVLDVVAGLPPTQLALAFEQVRSRYVRFLLGRTRRSGARAAARV